MSDMILFDLDGTLTDSGPGITRCVQYALASFGIEEPDLEKLNCYVFLLRCLGGGIPYSVRADPAR